MNTVNNLTLRIDQGDRRPVGRGDGGAVGPTVAQQHVPTHGYRQRIRRSVRLAIPTTIPIRAGRSYITLPINSKASPNPNQINSLQNLTPPIDACDDNRNTFDMYPSPGAAESPDTVNGHPADYYDAAGQLAFTAERIRRFVTPIDASGDGRVQTFGIPGAKSNYPTTGAGGGDQFGRIAFAHYFRPPGIPTVVSGNVVVDQSDDVDGPSPLQELVTTPGGLATIGSGTYTLNSPPALGIPTLVQMAPSPKS